MLRNDRDNIDDIVKSPYAALRFILRHCDVRTSTPHSSGFARLASGAFYFVVSIMTFYEFIKIDDIVKSPDASLRFIPRHCDVRPSTPHSSGFARLASGAFYDAVPNGTFFDLLRCRQHWKLFICLNNEAL